MVGSSKFPIDVAIGTQIVEEIRALGDVAILTRGRGNLDEFVKNVSIVLGLRCLTYPSRGGSDNWQRDVELVKDADEVLAFITQKDMELDVEKDRLTGTLHIVEKGLDQKKKVRLFTEVDGRLVYAAATEEGVVQ